MSVLDRVRRRKSTEGRRGQKGGRIRRPPRDLFINPYPWMSAPEAMVQLELERHGVPFSWRFFDGDPAPNFRELLVKDGFHPEFTLREHKAIIMVQGNFFGTLPGVLDKVALAQVAAEEDGWVAVILFETDIRAGRTWKMLQEKIPGLGSIKGPPRPNPYGGQPGVSATPQKPETIEKPNFPGLNDFDNEANFNEGMRQEDEWIRWAMNQGYEPTGQGNTWRLRAEFQTYEVSGRAGMKPAPGSPLDMLAQRKKQLGSQSVEKAKHKMTGGTRGVRNRGRHSRKPRERRISGRRFRRRDGS